MHQVPSAASLQEAWSEPETAHTHPSTVDSGRPASWSGQSKGMYAHTPQRGGSGRHVHGRSAVCRSGKLEAAWPWRLRSGRRRRSQLYRQPARVIIFCMAMGLWISAAAFCKII